MPTCLQRGVKGLGPVAEEGSCGSGMLVLKPPWAWGSAAEPQAQPGSLLVLGCTFTWLRKAASSCVEVLKYVHAHRLS